MCVVSQKMGAYLQPQRHLSATIITYIVLKVIWLPSAAARNGASCDQYLGFCLVYSSCGEHCQLKWNNV